MYGIGYVASKAIISSGKLDNTKKQEILKSVVKECDSIAKITAELKKIVNKESPLTKHNSLFHPNNTRSETYALIILFNLFLIKQNNPKDININDLQDFIKEQTGKDYKINKSYYNEFFDTNLPKIKSRGGQKYNLQVLRTFAGFPVEEIIAVNEKSKYFDNSKQVENSKKSSLIKKDATKPSSKSNIKPNKLRTGHISN